MRTHTRTHTQTRTRGRVNRRSRGHAQTYTRTRAHTRTHTHTRGSRPNHLPQDNQQKKNIQKILTSIGSAVSSYNINNLQDAKRRRIPLPFSSTRHNYFSQTHVEGQTDQIKTKTAALAIVDTRARRHRCYTRRRETPTR